jgi:hypothetical protein
MTYQEGTEGKEKGSSTQSLYGTSGFGLSIVSNYCKSLHGHCGGITDDTELKSINLCGLQ